MATGIDAQKAMLDTVKREGDYAIGVLGSDVGPSYNTCGVGEHRGDPVIHIFRYISVSSFGM